MREFRLSLTAEELNQVLAVLGGQPHNAVAPLIAKLHAQAGRQIEAHEARRQARVLAKQAPG
jgi:hypothetical protein